MIFNVLIKCQMALNTYEMHFLWELPIDVKNKWFFFYIFIKFKDFLKNSKTAWRVYKC